MRTVATVLGLLLLSACERGEEAAPAPTRDPATVQALADQIMVDPDLANQNEGNAALTVSSDHSLPLHVSTPDGIAAARAEAAQLVGGSENLVPPPRARRLSGGGPDVPSTPAQIAAALPGGRACALRIEYSAAWAARMPPTLPIYPGGATIEAAGTDSTGCNLRVITFVTPVEPGDLLSFYTARAGAAKFNITHAANETRHVLSGKKGGAGFRLALRLRDDGLTEATLATIGG